MVRTIRLIRHIIYLPLYPAVHRQNALTRKFSKDVFLVYSISHQAFLSCVQKFQAKSCCKVPFAIKPCTSLTYEELGQ